VNIHQGRTKKSLTLSQSPARNQ